MNYERNIFIEIVLIPLFLFKYFLCGLKVIFYDSIAVLFKTFNFNANHIGKKYDDEKKVSILKKNLEKKLAQQKNNDDKKHIYRYIAKDTDGKLKKSTILGASYAEVYTFLQGEGLEIYDLKTSFLIDAFYKETVIGSRRLSSKQIIFWLTQLSTYLKSGLTLSEATKIVLHQMKVTKSQFQGLQGIIYELNLGENFSAALEHQEKLFPAFMINMIKTAEASGTLIETLDDLANYYTELEENHKQMINALMYPLIILIFSILVIVFIMVYVVPQFERIYANSDASITGITKVLINVSNFTKNNFISIFLVIFFSIFLLIYGYKKDSDIRKSIQIIVMKIPIIRNIIIYNEISIFANTFASLLKSNVYITDSMNLLGKITNNEIYKEICQNTINNIVKGEKISDAFSNNWAVPDVAYYMIVTGENTGELQPMMKKVGDYYRSQHKQLVNSFKTFIEPILITILTVIVGGIIISIIIPMFDIYGTIR